MTGRLLLLLLLTRRDDGLPLLGFRRVGEALLLYDRAARRCTKCPCSLFRSIVDGQDGWMVRNKCRGRVQIMEATRRSDDDQRLLPLSIATASAFRLGIGALVGRLGRSSSVD